VGSLARTPTPRAGRYGPEGLERTFTAAASFHDDRVDVREDVTWTWYESKRLSLDFAVTRHVRRGNSTRVRTLELRGSHLVALPVTADEPPTATVPVQEDWAY
jgi:hypothetical protein